MHILGIDIGGSGIKGAVVDTETGELVSERLRLETPQPATPEAMAKTVGELVKAFDWKKSIGVTFPAIVRDNVACTASNIDDAWIGTNIAEMFEKTTGCPVRAVNDADAAGIAEIRFGGGRGFKGTLFLITVGTGLGTALIRNGELVPNTELGHLILKKHGNAERYCADSARKRKDLSWGAWAKRFNNYLKHLDFLFSPDCFVIGGGVSKKPEKFMDRLTIDTPVKMAELQNQAGIIGAALVGRELEEGR